MGLLRTMQSMVACRLAPQRLIARKLCNNRVRGVHLDDLTTSRLGICWFSPFVLSNGAETCIDLHDRVPMGTEMFGMETRQGVDGDERRANLNVCPTVNSKAARARIFA